MFLACFSYYRTCYDTLGEAHTHTQSICRDSIPHDASVAYCDAVIIVWERGYDRLAKSPKPFLRKIKTSRSNLLSAIEFAQHVHTDLI